MFERYYRELLNFLARKVGDRELAADLAQESYARVYAAPNSEEASEPRALLYTTARNLVTDHHRRSAVREQVEMPNARDSLEHLDFVIGPASLEPDAVLAGRQRLEAIEEVIARLPPRPREAFVLSKLDGLSRSEVAQRMGVGVKTVETHLAIAMEACLHRLQELEGLAPAASARSARKARTSK
ncbi:sigma-70 family RNA polymerase sigma factor [Ottowia thiooxydans]|uniref:sigma-70 family RNA polymerase sigma factor n=1 Tax=Ottowia thiooxydans TaxID=219182 RepID=UPI00040D37DC|nr:sigma-70 family RNA polymerase sigma factor [Ottowia thiooxydans]